MKKYFVFLLAVCFLCLTVCAEEADEYTAIIEEYTKIYGEKLSEGITDSAEDDILALMPDFSIDGLLSEAAGNKGSWSPGGILAKLVALLAGEMRKAISLLIFIPGISILNSSLLGINANFKTKGATNATFFVSYAVMAGIMASAFIETIRCASGAIGNIAVFLRGLVPVTLASLAVSGAAISATTFEVVLMSVIEITEIAVEKFFFPLVMMSAALSIANNISKNINAEKLVQLLTKTVKWGIGIMMTVFVGITGLQGIAAGSADGLSVKVTKFMTANLIPMVGGLLAETVETVMNCSVVIKNAVGIVGIVVIVIITALPLIKVGACLIIFRVCAALIQPIGDEKSVKCVTELGDSISAVLGMTTAVAVMFVIILTIVINIGNTAVLMGR